MFESVRLSNTRLVLELKRSFENKATPRPLKPSRPRPGCAWPRLEPGAWGGRGRCAARAALEWEPAGRGLPWPHVLLEFKTTGGAARSAVAVLAREDPGGAGDPQGAPRRGGYLLKTAPLTTLVLSFRSHYSLNCRCVSRFYFVTVLKRLASQHRRGTTYLQHLLLCLLLALCQRRLRLLLALDLRELPRHHERRLLGAVEAAERQPLAVNDHVEQRQVLTRP